MQTTRDDLIVCFARHKCASGWLSDLLLDIKRQLGLKFDYVHNEESFGHDIGTHVRTNGIQVLVFGNAQTTYLPGLPPYRGFHVVRDPRDLLVSAYYSHRNSHELQPWLHAHRTALQVLDLDAGLHLQMDFPMMEFILGQIRDWDYDNPRVLELRYEDVTVRPDVELRRAFEFVGFFDRGLTDAHFQALVDTHSFKAKSGGRLAGEVDPRSHYRRGVVGDWRHHFSPAHVDHFKRKYGEVVLRLGYESDSEWGL